MSMFSGKCDFYDGFVAIRCDGDESKVEEALKKLELYVYGNDGRVHRVKSDTIMDIVKYYPYLESMMYGNKDGTCVVILSSDSYIDREEKEHRRFYIDDVLKYWRKCKRLKKPFTVDECVEVYNHWTKNTELIREIAERVERDGKDAEFDDIHLPMQEYFRQRWFEEMVRVGYTEQKAYNWCFKGLFDKEDTIVKRLGRPLKDEVQPG